MQSPAVELSPNETIVAKEELGLSWAELNRRLGTHPYTMRRWAEGRVWLKCQHWRAHMKVANSLGLGHLFTE